MGEINVYWENIERLSHQEFVPEDIFTLEYTFSVYSAGFKASVVTKNFDDLLFAYGIQDRETGHFIPSSSETCAFEMATVLSVIANRKKAEAIQKTRKMIAEMGYKVFHETFLLGKDPAKIALLPFMGPALRYHVARNIGNVTSVKPDIHLNRLASHYGIESAQKLCETISGFPPAYNDLILWLASADHRTRP